MAAMVERECKNAKCRKLFMARVADVRRGWARFCCKSCKAQVQEARTGACAAHKRRQRAAQERDDDDDWGHPFASGFEGHGQH